MVCRLSKVIGSGEFGTVYRGVWFPSESLSEGELPEQQQKDKHSHLGQAVAVKCMDDSSTEKEQVKFLQEAAMMAQFNHPNIINLLGIVIQDQVMTRNGKCDEAKKKKKISNTVPHLIYIQYQNACNCTRILIP